MVKIALVLVAVFVLLLVAGFVAHAQSYGTTGTSGTSSSGSGSSSSSSTSTTTPGTPNTGAGGEATTNALVLGSSALVALLGTTYLVRRGSR